MKKYLAASIVAGLLALGVYSTHSLRADAQGGNTAAAFAGNGVTLNTNVQPSATDRATLRTNLGSDTDDVTKTNTTTISGTGSLVITSTGAGLVLTGTPAAPVQGTIALTSTSVKVYLTTTTGLLIKSGTVTTF